jgi:hypothetical protein
VRACVRVCMRACVCMCVCVCVCVCLRERERESERERGEEQERERQREGRESQRERETESEMCRHPHLRRTCVSKLSTTSCWATMATSRGSEERVRTSEHSAKTSLASMASCSAMKRVVLPGRALSAGYKNDGARSWCQSLREVRGLNPRSCSPVNIPI